MEGEVTVYAQPGAGYKNWKKATSKDGFRKHVDQNCSKHHSAALEYDNRKTTVQDVALAIEDQSVSERIQNRSRIKFILDVCLLLAKQEIVFRGNNEKDNSENKGNFLEFVQFMVQYVPILHEQWPRQVKTPNTLRQVCNVNWFTV
ncbi:hypothetical protein PF002_g2591 [Phytophthora fragariae]|nr:hypothetical protein PF011_g2126 [Phytophthora fragariae]KAE9252307.1 hypothetical protein PF004_g2034 [Phytophthora fragariae]KAE9254954.1 hypothetical protein PF002_g2591 [Phytophthora fragariae]